VRASEREERDDPGVTDVVATTPADAPRRGLPRTEVIVVVAVVLVVALALLLWALNRGDDVDRRVAVDRGGLDSAVLELGSGADSLTVTSGDTGGDLAVVTTPDGSRVRPLADLDGDHLLVRTADVHADDDGDGRRNERADGPADVTVRLSDDVRWDVVVDGGSQRLRLDLAGTKVRRADVRAGQGVIDATLPKPSGVLALEIAGGAGTVSVHAPAGVPARLLLGNGAGSASLDADRRSGIAAGTVITSPGWNGNVDRVDVVASSGVGTIRLDRS
jgi:hypothetical protein